MRTELPLRVERLRGLAHGVIRMVRSDGLGKALRFATRKFLFETSMGNILYAAYFHVLLKPHFLVWRYLNRGLPVEVPCVHPFTDIEISGSGLSYLCCPSWLPVPMGSMKTDSIKGLFNSAIAQSVRISMYRGRPIYCNEAVCMILSSPSFRSITADEILRVETITEEDKRRILDRELRFPHGPSRLTECVDALCNIRCEFCRPAKTGGFDAGKDSKALFAKLLDYTTTHASELRLVAFSGGEPLINPWVQRVLTAVQNRSVSFQFTSNLNRIDETMKGLLRGISIHTFHGSLNAASRDTYQRLCRHGNWDGVLRNLDFILELRDSASRRFSVQISMVVAKWNYMEVAAFAELGVSLNVDKIIYYPLNEFPENQFLKLGDCERQELDRLLESEIFVREKARIELGALRASRG